MEAKITKIYYWVSRAYWKDMKSFRVPDEYREAAKHVADEGFHVVVGLISSLPGLALYNIRRGQNLQKSRITS